MSFRTKWEKATANARTFLYLRRLLRESRITDADAVRRIQRDRLKRRLIHAFENFEFYRNRFQNCGFDPYHFSSIDQLAQIPVLTKGEYRDFTKCLHDSSPLSFRDWYQDGTSGSTGTPLKIWRTWDERAYMVAKWMRVLYLNGYSWNDITFSLPSPHRLQRDSVLQRLGIMKRYAIPYTAPVEEMVSEYVRVRPTVLYGNKSQLVEMALYAQRRSLALPPPRFYICAAETLDTTSREILLRTFGENLSEVYGAVEFNTLAWRTVRDANFHFSHTTDVLELTDNASVSALDGHCVITDLFIYSFPLIRYQLGDYLETETQRGLRVLKRIRGRLDDWVVFRDGTRKSFHPFYEIMERHPEILQFRVIQESLSLLRILMVREPSVPAPPLEAALLKDLRCEVRSGDIDYRLEWVDELLPEQNGKLRMLVSNVKQEADLVG